MKHPSVFVPQRPHAPLVSSRDSGASQQATADIARKQLDRVYASDPNHQMSETPAESISTEASAAIDTPQASSDVSPAVARYQEATAVSDNPYERSHSDTSSQTATPDWQTYHSAWQNYYQQYFQRYYAGHIEQTQSTLAQQSQRIQELETAPHDMSTDEALTDLRSRLRHTITTKAKKARKSRHFVPVAAGVCVMLLFAFLQYNSLFIANVIAYASPGTIEPVNIIADPNQVATIGPEPRLIIPKINVDVPVVWDAQPDHDSQMAAMEHGVARFGIKGANAMPGQVGNTVLSGHSSNQWIDNGKYKFIFVRLEQMSEGDVIYLNYQGTRYTYKITQKQVVAPTNVSALQIQTTKPLLTLITCVPIGTADNRLLVTAEQINPDPAAATKAVEPSTPVQGGSAMPGNSPTVLERMFGAR